jgi:SAM-dependent methyltransferase
MSMPVFEAAERQALMQWFDGHAVSRFWVSFRADRALNIAGYLANSSVGLDDFALALGGGLLPDVQVHTWQGLDDPDNDPDPALFRVFRWWPGLKGIGFSASVPFEKIRSAAGAADHVKVEIIDRRSGKPIVDSVQALYLPVSDFQLTNMAVFPPNELIRRVMGFADSAEWLLTGYTNVRVIDEVMRLAAGRSLASCNKVLEWGSGCGRLSRHLIRTGSQVTGIDIDREAVEWCNKNLSPNAKAQADFQSVGLLPPTNLPSRTFDLVIGISVITHLDENNGNAWLEELSRVVRRDGVLVLTTHGLDTFSAVHNPVIYRELTTKGTVSVPSPHLNDVLGTDQEYYRESWHSWDWIREKWARWFTVCDIVRGGHFGYQDMVVLRNTPAIHKNAVTAT